MQMEKGPYEKLLNVTVYLIYIDYLASVTEKAILDARRKEAKK